MEYKCKNWVEIGNLRENGNKTAVFDVYRKVIYFIERNLGWYNSQMSLNLNCIALSLIIDLILVTLTYD